MLLSISQGRARGPLGLQLETRGWEGDGDTDSLHCLDVLLEFVLVHSCSLVFVLFVCKHFADGVVRLEKRDLVVADTTGQLIEAAENPQNVELPVIMTFHAAKLFEDRECALAKE